MLRQALTCDTFLMSSNAISEDGQLVNIDGMGNRVAALCFGPKQVIVMAGMNKVAGDLDSAISRARHMAAPANAQRFDVKTPCAVTAAAATAPVPTASAARWSSPGSVCRAPHQGRSGGRGSGLLNAKEETLWTPGYSTGTDAAAEAAAILRRGGLLGIPTETVYGLGADALNEDAVRRIFEAKGRPQDNPLIIHVPAARLAGALLRGCPAGGLSAWRRSSGPAP